MINRLSSCIILGNLGYFLTWMRLFYFLEYLCTIRAMTSLQPLACNHCGAALEVEASTRFVTCAYCGSRLEVHRTGNSAYTSVLDAIDQRTQQIAENVEIIKIQNQLEQLDRQWQMQRDSLMVRNKDGTSTEPTVIGNAIVIVMGLFAMGFAIFWMVMAFSMGAPFPFPCFGLIFLIVVPLGIFSQLQKSKRFEQSRASYEEERQRLQDMLDQHAQ